MMKKIFAVLGITAVLFSVFGVFSFATNGSILGEQTATNVEYYQYPDSYSVFSNGAGGIASFSTRSDFLNGAGGCYFGNAYGDFSFYDANVYTDYVIPIWFRYDGSVDVVGASFRDMFAPRDLGEINAIILNYEELFYHSALGVSDIVFAVQGVDLGDGCIIRTEGTAMDRYGNFVNRGFDFEVNFDTEYSGYAALSVPMEEIFQSYFDYADPTYVHEDDYMYCIYDFSVSLQPIHEVTEMGRFIVDYNSYFAPDLRHNLSSTFFYQNGFDSTITDDDEKDFVGWAFTAISGVFDFPFFYVGSVPVTALSIISLCVGLGLFVWFIKLFAGG